MLRFLHVLASFLTPAFEVEQQFPPRCGERRSLHVTHRPGAGYAVFETRTDEAQGETAIDAETFEDGLTRPQALRLAARSGARPETAAAVQASRSALVPAPVPLQLEVHGDLGVVTLHLHEHLDQPGFLAALEWALRTTDAASYLALIGREGEQELAWQVLFERVPWGRGTVREIERLTAHL